MEYLPNTNDFLSGKAVFNYFIIEYKSTEFIPKLYEQSNLQQTLFISFTKASNKIFFYFKSFLIKGTQKISEKY